MLKFPFVGLRTLILHNYQGSAASVTWFKLQDTILLYKIAWVAVALLEKEIPLPKK